MRPRVVRRIDQLHGLMASAVEAADVPGAAMLVADRDGVLFAEAFGRRGVADNTPMTLDSLFWLASMTKAVTSAAAMQLVERGLLELDAPISALLPELGKPQVLMGFDANGTPRLRPAARPITLRHLLTHTAGFTYDTFSADMMRFRGEAGPAKPGQRAGLNGPLLFDPGDGWEYGVSTDWVGLAVEAASGQRLDAYFAEHLFRPLKMTDTGFVFSPADKERVAALHLRGGDGSVSVIPSPVADAAEWEVLLGGAGLIGTGGDYVRFMRMILNKGMLDGVRVLKSETVDLMSENQVGSLLAGSAASIFPRGSNRPDLFPGMGNAWGLGFLINSLPGKGGRATGSLSWTGLANCYYWIDSTSGLCAVLLAQLLPFGDSKMLGLLESFETAIYAGP
jgi:methyl acetate hydrolase